MTTTPVPYIDAGQAEFTALDTYTQKFLLMGPEPKLASHPFELAASQTFANKQVVGLNSSGKLVKATWDADPDVAIKAIGVVIQAVTSGSSGVVTVPIFYSGYFNIDALAWDASFDTDAKKLAAFQGAPTPTTILCGKRPT